MECPHRQYSLYHHLYSINMRYLLIFSLLFTIACNKDSHETSNSKYISKVFEYVPAPGQFINTDIGNSAAAQRLIGNTNNVLTLGAWGGYIVFGFDHAIENKTDADFAIYSNTIETLSEPGIVMVSQDVNSNGKPDDTWYTLAGDGMTNSATIKNYSITYYNPGNYANVKWKDNQGDTGSVRINPYHTQNYYPLFASNQDSITFTGIRLPATFKDSAGLYTNRPFIYGYADNYSSIPTDNYKANGYNSLDISNAVDVNGNAVTLSSINFVKVYTGQNSAGNTTIGEISTEISGAVDLHL